MPQQQPQFHYPTPTVGKIPPGTTVGTRNDPILPAPAPPAVVGPEIPGNRTPTATITPTKQAPTAAPPAPPLNSRLAQFYAARNGRFDSKAVIRSNRVSRIYDPRARTTTVNYSYPVSVAAPEVQASSAFGGGAPGVDESSSLGDASPFASAGLLPIALIAGVAILALRFLKKR